MIVKSESIPRLGLELEETGFCAWAGSWRLAAAIAFGSGVGLLSGSGIGPMFVLGSFGLRAGWGSGWGSGLNSAGWGAVEWGDGGWGKRRWGELRDERSMSSRLPSWSCGLWERSPSRLLS